MTRPRTAARAAGTLGWVLVAAVALLAVLGGGVFALTAQRVDGTSMEPTLHDGQLLAADPLHHTPDRFDVVLLRPDAASGELVKRVVGLPGDGLWIGLGADGQARVRVRPAGAAAWSTLVRPDGAEPWRTGASCCGADGRLSDRPAAVTVPAGEYFVLGDNPESSLDSRSFGFVAADAVRATVPARWSPFGPLDDPGYRLR